MYANFITILKNQKPIGMPTETVYGLASDATSDQAVAEIYALKERPSFNPLILHVSSLDMAKRYGEFNQHALTLANYFWNPSEFASSLTIVVPYKRASNISSLARAGLQTVGIRVPNHPIPLEIIEKFEKPLAIPSANKSFSLSPTRFEHVRTSFPHLEIIEGGPCQVGIESTIVDCSTEIVSILRHGIVTREAIEEVLGFRLYAKKSKKIMAPGGLMKHYAPKTPLRINCLKVEEGEALLGFGEMECSRNLSPSGNLVEAAANLFEHLHTLDQEGHKAIVVTPIPMEGVGFAINDKLKRASS